MSSGAGAAVSNFQMVHSLMAPGYYTSAKRGQLNGFSIEFVKDIAELYGVGTVSEAAANTISTHVNCLIKLILIAARSNRIASGRLNFDIDDLYVAAKDLGIN
uniref:Uncharacterized protein n=1 Tax=Panagrolaimus sp. PS1159 TaxID=55785 RepID=A0AC35G1C5_9BILA